MTKFFGLILLVFGFVVMAAGSVPIGLVLSIVGLIMTWKGETSVVKSSSHHPSVSMYSRATGSKIEELERIEVLLKKGTITQDEFEDLKRKLLNDF